MELENFFENRRKKISSLSGGREIWNRMDWEMDWRGRWFFFLFNFSLYDNSGIIKRLEDFTSDINIFAVHAFDFERVVSIARTTMSFGRSHGDDYYPNLREGRNGRFPIKLWGNI